MDTSKGTEKVNEEGAVEVKVETVDYRNPPGKDEEPVKEKVEITHLTPKNEKPVTGNVVSDAAGKVAEKVLSAKEAVFPSGDDKKTE